MCNLRITRGIRVGLWLLFCAAILTGVTSAAFYWVPATQKYTITERYRFTTGRHDATVYLAVLTPKSGPYQEISEPEIAWPGTYNVDEGRYVNTITFSDLVPDHSYRESQIKYDVRLPQGSATWSAPVEFRQKFPQKNVESDDEKIMARAAELTSGTTRDDVHSILMFTWHHLVPSEEPAQFTKASAVRAFNTGIGCCGEYANLMVALCRAANIPAQTVIGLLLPDLPPYSLGLSRSDHAPGETHAWVEVFSEGRWELADPSCGGSSLRRALLGKNDGRHLSYGEASRLADTFEEAKEWVLSRGELIGEKLATVKYVASSDAYDVTVVPTITLKKGWDGRWMNLIVAWLVTTLLLWRLNLRQIERFFPG